MVAKKKKELIVPTRRRADELVARIRASNPGRDVYCASDLMKNWRFIDFFNPRDKMPCLGLEWYFGARGLLAGRIMKLQAKYGVGKSSFMWLMYASGQVPTCDAYCYHIESEAAPPPPDYIWSFGCDPAKLVTEQPKSLEQCFAYMDEAVCHVRGGLKGGINPDTGRQQKTKFDDPLDPNMEAPLIVGVDSVSALGLETSVEADVIDMRATEPVAAHSRKLGIYFRDRSERFKLTQTLVMMAAQEKAVIPMGGPFSHGNDQKKSSTLGDGPIGFHSTYVVEMKNFKYKNEETSKDLGERIVCVTSKNKLSPKNRQIELYLVRDRGFDLVKTDMEFLTRWPESPLAGQIVKGSHGIKCPLVSDKWFKSEKADDFKKGDLEFLQTFYANTDLVMACREKLRIRGFGFDFETKYMPSMAEIEDNALSAESDLHGVESNGLVGSTGEIPSGKDAN